MEAALEARVAQRPEKPCRGFAGARHRDRPFADIAPFRRRQEGGNSCGVTTKQILRRTRLLRPDVGRRRLRIVEAEWGDQDETPYERRRDRRDLGGKPTTNRRPNEGGSALNARALQQVECRGDPIEQRIELV